MREVLEGFEGGIRIGGERISNLRFADDTTLLCTSKELLNLQRKVKDVSRNKNLELNAKKTKDMVIDPRRSKKDIYLDNDLIEKVDHFVYLGSMINLVLSKTAEDTLDSKNQPMDPEQDWTRAGITRGDDQTKVGVFRAHEAARTGEVAGNGKSRQWRTERRTCNIVKRTGLSQQLNKVFSNP